MERVVQQKRAIAHVLSEDRKTRHLVPAWQDSDVLEAIHTSLRPLVEFTDALSSKKYVSVHLESGRWWCRPDKSHQDQSPGLPQWKIKQWPTDTGTAGHGLCCWSSVQAEICRGGQRGGCHVSVLSRDYFMCMSILCVCLAYHRGYHIVLRGGIWAVEFRSVKLSSRFISCPNKTSQVWSNVVRVDSSGSHLHMASEVTPLGLGTRQSSTLPKTWISSTGAAARVAATVSDLPSGYWAEPGDWRCTG